MKKLLALFLAILTLFSASAVAQEAAVPPVYRAQQRTQEAANFFDVLDAGWFNDSGVASIDNGSRRGRLDLYTFQDGAKLDVGMNSLYYNEYDGEYFMHYFEDPTPGGPFPRPSFASEIGSVASMAYFRQNAALENKELSSLSLIQADEAVQALFEKLGLTGYQLCAAVDMTVERIHKWGAESVEENQNAVNRYDRCYDFSQATEADEGYYLRYEKALGGIRFGNPDGGAFYAWAFVNQTGVVSFQLCETFAVGEAAYVPETLVTEAELKAAFEADNPRRVKDGFLEPTFLSAELVYIPMRAANPAEGMVIAPAWYVSYTFMDGSLCDGWAYYSALDGALVEDCYS